MILLGLTGSIGMGKSTVAQMFADEGIPVFDADEVVHRLQGPEGIIVEAIEAAFPGSTGSGGVDRTALAEQALAGPDTIRRLEKIVHPAVAAEKKAFVERHCDAPIVLLDIPLLFEKGSWQNVDKIIVVSAPEDIQRRRVLARPGMTEPQLAKILSLQMPDAEKRSRADFVVDTGGSLDETRASVRRILACLAAAGDS